MGEFMRKRVLGAVCALAILMPAGLALAGDAAVLVGPRMVHMPGAAPQPASPQAAAQPATASPEKPATVMAAPTPPRAAPQSETAAAEPPREVARNPAVSPAPAAVPAAPRVAGKNEPAESETRGSSAAVIAAATVVAPRNGFTAKVVKTTIIRKPLKGRRGRQAQEQEAAGAPPLPAPPPAAAPAQSPGDRAEDLAEADDAEAPIPPLPQPLQGADAFAPAAPRVMPVSGPANGRNKKKQAWMSPTRYQNKCHASWGQLAGHGPFRLCVLN